MTVRTRSDEGFTLLEMIIAMMVMSVAVVTLVGALASMLELSREHRGHAVIETASHSFSQAVMAAGQFQTTLTADVSASQSSLPVADASLLAVGHYVSVDRETMRVTSVGAGSIDVARGTNGATTQAVHLAGASVSRILRCPTAAELTPPPGTYMTTAAVLSPTVINPVEYWDPSINTFATTSGSGCLAAYNAVCGTDVLAECGTGLYRATLRATTTGDARLRDLSTTTAVLIRTGGS